jgi:hypothetical protein
VLLIIKILNDFMYTPLFVEHDTNVMVGAMVEAQLSEFSRVIYDRAKCGNILYKNIAAMIVIGAATTAMTFDALVRAESIVEGCGALGSGVAAARASGADGAADGSTCNFCSGCTGIG